MGARRTASAPNACTNPDSARSPAFFRSKLKAGTGWWEAIKLVGQPDRRLDRKFSYCTTTGTLTVTLDQAGKVTRVTA